MEVVVVEGGGNYHKRLIDLFCMAIVCQFGSFFFSFRQNPQQKYKAYHHLNISPSASSYNIQNSSLFIVFWGPHRVNIDPDARRAQKNKTKTKTKSIESRKGGRNNHHHHYIYIPQDTANNRGGSRESNNNNNNNFPSSRAPAGRPSQQLFPPRVCMYRLVRRGLSMMMTGLFNTWTWNRSIAQYSMCLQVFLYLKEIKWWPKIERNI